jgi:peptidoglycan/xylan/chitin deacetylase (PgdA/CDA1 family)
MIRIAAFVVAMLAAPFAAAMEPCPNNADALGTERVMTVDTAATPWVGRKQFPETLPLNSKELVLTFDDGPWPTTTPKVLDALKHECVRATFFLIGRNAQANPQIARRALAEGHTLGHHTFSHPLLGRMRTDKGEAEIDRGIAADETAIYGRGSTVPTTPFFRFPGFASNQALLDRMQARGIVVFGADVWASDWLPKTPDEELRLLLARIAKIDHGIVLLHDTKAQTARMLPAFLRALKAGGYSIVHVVPAMTGHEPGPVQVPQSADSTMDNKAVDETGR